jgi:hypothetical protein
MQRRTTEVLCIDHLASSSLDQRRPTQKDGSILVHDHTLVGHGGNVCASGGARAHDHRNLWNVLRRHGGLVVEDATEMLAIREHIGLQRKERTATVDCKCIVHRTESDHDVVKLTHNNRAIHTKIYAGKMVLACNLLRTQMLLDRDRVVGTTFDSGIICDNHALRAVSSNKSIDPGCSSGGGGGGGGDRSIPMDVANTSDDTTGRYLIGIEVITCQLRQFEEW